MLITNVYFELSSLRRYNEQKQYKNHTQEDHEKSPEKGYHE